MLQQGISLYHRVDRCSLPYCTLSLVQTLPITQWSAHKLWDQWEVLFLCYLWGRCKETSLHLAADNILAPRWIIESKTSQILSGTYFMLQFLWNYRKYKLIFSDGSSLGVWTKGSRQRDTGEQQYCSQVYTFVQIHPDALFRHGWLLVCPLNLN